MQTRAWRPYSRDNISVVLPSRNDVLYITLVLYVSVNDNLSKNHILKHLICPSEPSLRKLAVNVSPGPDLSVNAHAADAPPTGSAQIRDFLAHQLGEADPHGNRDRDPTWVPVSLLQSLLAFLRNLKLQVLYLNGIILNHKVTEILTISQSDSLHLCPSLSEIRLSYPILGWAKYEFTRSY